MQVSRLLSGSVDVDKFDFNYLHLQGARFGQKALENLQRQTTGPQAAKIREQAKTALLATPPKLILYVPPEDQSSIPPIPAPPLHRATLILINTPNSTLPDSFLNQNWHQNANVAALPSCLLIDKYSVGLRKCDAWLVRIADVPTVILFQSDRPELFQAFQQDSQRTWQLIGQWRLTTNCPKKHLNAVISGGGFKLEAPFSPSISQT
jgi:hypothetical protein